MRHAYLPLQNILSIWVAKASSPRGCFMETIYVRLLGEGTDVYRPVPADRICASVFVVGGETIRDPENEEWEFLPGTKVY